MAQDNEISRGYVFDLEANRIPVAVISPIEQEAVLGSVVRLDGRASYDPDPNATLTYTWTFLQIPIGSQIENDGFTALEPDNSVVGFAPDVIGHYKAQLVVNDGSLDSDPVYGEIDVRVLLVPYHKGLVPDASWIWKFLSDFWNKVENRRKFEVFWSAAIQIVASELLKLYQYDYNKSLADIQRLMQRRWLYYSAYVELDPATTSFILAQDQAGLEASTALITPSTGIVDGAQPDYSNMVSIPLAEGSFQSAPYTAAISKGRVLQVGNRGYTLGRSGTVLRAANWGRDGSTVPVLGDLPNTFRGSGFRSEHVGYTLKINEGSLAGSYNIEQVVNSNAVVLDTALDPRTGLFYSVLPTTTDSAFFSDREEVVPTKQFHQPWRFSATLKTNIDLEAQGVSPGDTVVVEVTRTDTSKTATFSVQVVSVDRTSLGFVLPLDAVTPGEPMNGLPEDAQVALADALQIYAITEGPDKKLYYTEDAAVVKSTLQSVKFKRTYYEVPLTPDSEIDLGPFSVTLTPLRIIRNRVWPITEDIESIPVLQEYIKQPDTVTQNQQLYQVTDNKLYPLTRVPKVLVENLDYVIDSDDIITGACHLQQGEDKIEIPYGDLIDRSIHEGDELFVQVGPQESAYDIVKVVDAENVRVVPTPNTTVDGAGFRLQRRIKGKYLRFIPDVFTPASPAPERLWAEVSYFDNNAIIEGNFGALAGLTLEQLNNQQGTVDYLSAIAGLAYALVESGPTISKMELAAHILLGQPFSKEAGVIIGIDQVYRRTLDGAPLYGRMLIESRDAKNQPTGVIHIYLIPLGAHIETEPGVWEPIDTNIAGFGINLETGAEYQVGDHVGQFAKLSKGVEIQSYPNVPDWYQSLVDQGVLLSPIEKYHKFRLLVNADLVRTEDIDLASQFLRKTKTSHTSILSSLLRLMVDRLEIEDSLTFSYATPPILYDTPAFSLPMPTKFDRDLAGDIFLTYAGSIYSTYLRGGDMISNGPETAEDNDVVTSAAGGFINTRAEYSEVHDIPFIREGDILDLIDGPNLGRYPVSEVVSDHALRLELNGRVLTSASLQSFSIYRPTENPFFRTSVVVAASAVVTIEDGGFSAGVAVDDLLIFYNPSDPTWVSKQYRIAAFNAITHALTLLETPAEGAGTYSAIIVREALVKKYFLAEADEYPHQATFSEGSPWVEFSGSASDVLQIGMLCPGDVIEHPAIPLSAIPMQRYTVARLDYENLRAYIQPAALHTGTGISAKLIRPTRSAVVVSTDILDRYPDDRLDLALTSGDADLTTTAGSDVVSTVSGQVFDDPAYTPQAVDPPPGDWHIINNNLSVNPGDELEILSGLDQGFHTVVDVRNTTLQLITELLADHPEGIGYRLWRRRPQ